MTRREFKNENCFSHLGREVTTLRHELSALEAQLSEQKRKFESKVDIQAEEIRQLVEENLKSRQRLEIVELCSDIPICKPKWQQIHNMQNGPQNVLEVVQPYSGGICFVQSANALTRTRPSFKVHFLDSPAKYLPWIGLTRREYFSELHLNKDKSVDEQIIDIHYRIDAYHCLFQPSLQNGDVIECGIEFNEDSLGNLLRSSGFYCAHLSVNGNLIKKKTFKMPPDGVFPTIIFRSSDFKIRYLQKLDE